jgi:hypothetical protein
MILMKTINTFALSKLTDSDLSRLLLECNMEQARREERKAAERQRWIDGYYFAFLSNPNASVVHVGETTVVAIWSRNLGLRMGTAVPVHGDVFDHDTGIAVAYAKAVGDSIPNFI